jgi:predicted kinase
MSSTNGGRRVLVTGGGAVGKSTVCRLVAESLPRSTVIDADVVRESIVGGFVEPDPSFPAPFVEQIRLQREIVNVWIDKMAAAGYDVIIDDAMIPPPPHFHDDYDDLLADPASVRVLLVASKEALRARHMARSGPFDDWFLENLDELFTLAEGWLEHPAWSGWTIIDTSDIPPRDVAARILEQL